MTELKLQKWGNITVGDELPELHLIVDQTMINNYAGSSGDVNPLHIDPEFAKTTRFGRTIAHGLLSLAFVSQILSKWNWSGWAYSGELDVVFLGPVFPGNGLHVTGKVDSIEKRDEGVFTHCTISCSSEESTVLKGTAICEIKSDEI